MPTNTIDFDTAYFSWIPGTQTYEIHYEEPSDYQWRPHEITRDDLEKSLGIDGRARAQDVMTSPIRTKVGIWFPPRQAA